MTLKEFIKRNRVDLDICIQRVLDRPDYRLNDDERRQWILNDEGLYSWARSEGCRI